MPASKNTFKKMATAGFSMLEIIMVVGVMSVLAGLSAPPLMEFLKRRDIQAEQNALAEISKALKAYAADRNLLPSDTLAATNANGWATQIARYTNKSVNEIALDTWGEPRMYVMRAEPESFLGTTVNIFYASVHSAGPNRRAEGSLVNGTCTAATTGCVRVAGTSPTGFATFQLPVAAGTGWWRAGGTTTAFCNACVQRFVDMQPAADDLLTRFTDYPDKVDRYNTTLERMQGIAQALETYAKTQYATRVSTCTAYTGYTPPAYCSASPTTEQQVYYPRSQSAADNVAGGVAGSSAANLYGNAAESRAVDLTTFNSGAPITSTSANTQAAHLARRTQMINLMRLLGLPDSYCCSALTNIPNAAGTGSYVDPATGKPVGMPFYYFANPRPRSSATACGTRPVAASLKLPARITTQYVAAGTTGASCD